MREAESRFVDRPAIACGWMQNSTCFRIIISWGLHETTDLRSGRACRGCGGGVAARCHRATGECARVEIRAAGEPDGAGSGHHDRGGDNQPRLDGVRYTVRHQRTVATETTDGGRLYGFGR